MPRTLEKTKPGAKRILSTVVEDALPHARALAVRQASTRTATRFRIVDHAWCHLDFRQFLICERLLKMKPEDLLRIMRDELSPRMGEGEQNAGAFFKTVLKAA
jgi:hypothetical protein